MNACTSHHKIVEKLKIYVFWMIYSSSGWVLKTSKIFFIEKYGLSAFQHRVGCPHTIPRWFFIIIFVVVSKRPPKHPLVCFLPFNNLTFGLIYIIVTIKWWKLIWFFDHCWANFKKEEICKRNNKLGNERVDFYDPQTPLGQPRALGYVKVIPVTQSLFKKVNEKVKLFKPKP